MKYGIKTMIWLIKSGGTAVYSEVMLGNWKHHLLSLDFILASQSPRRQTLIKDMLQVPLICIPTGVEENIDKSTCKDAADYVHRTCMLKMNATMETVAFTRASIVVAADTIVCIDNQILEKPNNKDEIVAMISQLSGKSHQVMTAVCIYFVKSDGSKQLRSFVETTDVTFSMIPAEAIDAYADTTIAYDKAGGYGIQEYGGSTFVERISGCYYNVMGLPINRVARTIIELLES